MAETTQLGQLVIISGPSGAGKSTVLRILLSVCPLPLDLSISATTRPPRPAEVDGVDYHFLTADEFDSKLSNGEFLEHKEVFGRGHYYGTLRETVTTGLNTGRYVILEIDVAGAMSVLDHIPNAITIFIHPGTQQELENRLRGRETDSEESIIRRLEVAKSEMGLMNRYQHIIVNEQPETAAETICQILKNSGASS
ncbi:MAG: guanylate kinase [Pirellulales bacterium]|jgi:guanylate kinase|nr:guanylate kinase [Pirellulales bacterium]|tara:strand:- start:457 stop:1044 length:588 start_codon:yes stop_codon:yes gene_type:complete